MSNPSKITINLTDKDVDAILELHFGNQGFEYAGSQRIIDATPLQVQLRTDDVTKIKKE